MIMRKIRKRKKRRTGLRLIAAMVLFICGIVIFKRQDLEKEYNSKLLKKEALDRQIENENSVAKDLEEKKAYMHTKKFVEDVAREALGLVYKDEVLFQEGE